MYVLYSKIHIQYVYLVDEYLHIVLSQSHFCEITFGFYKIANIKYIKIECSEYHIFTMYRTLAIINCLIYDKNMYVHL